MKSNNPKFKKPIKSKVNVYSVGVKIANIIQGKSKSHVFSSKTLSRYFMEIIYKKKSSLISMVKP